MEIEILIIVVKRGVKLTIIPDRPEYVKNMFEVIFCLFMPYPTVAVAQHNAR